MPCSSSNDSIKTVKITKRSISTSTLNCHLVESSDELNYSIIDGQYPSQSSLKRQRCSISDLSNNNKRHSEAKYLEIEKIPGIGQAYAKRLNANKIFLLADLIDIFKTECDENEFEFQRMLKNYSHMRNDSAEKVTLFTVNFLNKLY